MNDELDKELCDKYPKIFRDRYASMQITAMCWGFECSEGWYNIIDHLCSNIQGHINWRIKSRESNIEFNEALEKALAGDKSTLIEYYARGKEPTQWTLDRVEGDIASGVFRTIESEIPQVVAEQVKEKFGGLRFYYRGGDEYIAGLVAMAQSMSYITCEVCGSPGKRNGGDWIRTLCREHQVEEDT
jgi:hypothetical protein